MYAYIFELIFRFASARYTDERIKLMNEIISGIRVIKMYGWEYAFKRLISEIRRCSHIANHNIVIFNFKQN